MRIDQPDFPQATEIPRDNTEYLAQKYQNVAEENVVDNTNSNRAPHTIQPNIFTNI